MDLTINQVVMALRDHNQALKGQWNYGASMVAIMVGRDSGYSLSISGTYTQSETVLMNAIASEIETEAYSEHAERSDDTNKIKIARLMAEIKQLGGVES